jgi:hypothetical protein
VLLFGCGGSSARAPHQSDDASGGSAPSGSGAANETDPIDTGSTAGGGTAGSTGSVPDDVKLLQQACAHLGAVRCSKLEDCSPVELVRQYGTKQGCEAAESVQCWQWHDGADNYDSSRIAVQIRAEMIGVGTCAEQAGLSGYASQPGSKPVGAGCQVREECESGYCARPSDGFCGTCEPSPIPAEHAGEPCEITDTSVGCTTPGRVCDLASETCVEPPGLGEPCIQHGADPSPTDWCASSLICAAGTCVTPLFYGEACTPSDDHCNRLAGLVCGADGTCDAETPRHVEGQCGGSPDAGDCGYADSCLLPLPGDDRPGECVPTRPVYGDACSDGLDCPMALTCLQQPGAGDGDDGVCGPRPMIDHQCD